MKTQISGIELLKELHGKEFIVFPKLKLKGFVEEKFFSKHLYKYAYIPWRICQAHASDKRLKGKEYVQIHSDDIKNALSTRRCTQIIENLISGGVIDRTPYYKSAESCKGYKLTEKYRKTKEWMILIQPKKEKKGSKNKNSPGESLDYLRSQLNRLEINPISI